jgi:AcrR family transcriptional regulator
MFSVTEPACGNAIMTLQAELARPARASEDDGAKRRQILDGAMAVFLEKGFDAASMGEIARAAGVSKGTLYVYFDDKQALFDAIVQEACHAHAERVFEFDNADHDVAEVLTQLGVAFAMVMCRPEQMSAVRTVIAIAERMPELGRKFYATGPARGIAKLAAYLDAQVAAGVIAVDDTEVAAAQFIDGGLSMLFKPVLFNYDIPSAERIEYVVRIAVRTFMAAYGRR